MSPVGSVLLCARTSLSEMRTGPLHGQVQISELHSSAWGDIMDWCLMSGITG